MRFRFSFGGDDRYPGCELLGPGVAWRGGVWVPLTSGTGASGAALGSASLSRHHESQPDNVRQV